MVTVILIDPSEESEHEGFSEVDVICCACKLFPFQVKEQNNRSASSTQSVSVTDNEDPTITAPSAKSANTSDDGNGNCTTTVSLGTPTTNDNCGVASVKAFVNGSEINQNSYAFPIGTTTVTWTVTVVVPIGNA